MLIDYGFIVILNIINRYNEYEMCLYILYIFVLYTNFLINKKT